MTPEGRVYPVETKSTSEKAKLWSVSNSDCGGDPDSRQQVSELGRCRAQVSALLDGILWATRAQGGLSAE